MDMLTEHLLFFVVGVVQDVIVTLYYQTITEKHPTHAAVLSGIITVVNLTVFYGILSALDQSVFSKIAAYALGNAVGTYLIVLRDKRKGNPPHPTSTAL